MVPSSDHAKSILILGGAAIAAYLAYLAYNTYKNFSENFSDAAKKKYDEAVAAAKARLDEAKVGAQNVIAGKLPNGEQDYSPQGLILGAGDALYQAGLGVVNTIGGVASDGKTYEDLTGYIMPSTWASTQGAVEL